jgi:hypothetical protein
MTGKNEDRNMNQIERRQFMQGAALGALAFTVGGAEVLLTPRTARAQGASAMTIIDSQVHAYEANTAKRPWSSVPNWPAHATGDEMVAAMDKVGVDGAIFISPFSMYRYDGSYAVEVQQAYSGRSPSSSRSIPTIRRSPTSSPTGKRRRAQSASASS